MSVAHLTSLHPARECSHAFSNISLNTFSSSDSLTVFTDGFKTEFGVASSSCAVKNILVIEWHCRFDNSSVHQAELFASLRAVPPSSVRVKNIE